MAGPNDLVLRTGDMIKITVPPPAIVPILLAPVPLVGSSTKLSVFGQVACLVGDELPPSLRGPLPYTAPPFVAPGTGSLRIVLTPDNFSLRTTNGKPVLLKGTSFTVIFNVMAPAMQPTPAGPVPDPVVVKPGTGLFITTTNATVRLK